MFGMGFQNWSLDVGHGNAYADSLLKKAVVSLHMLMYY